MKKVLYFFIIIAFSMSCEKAKDTFDNSIKVGNILLSDGSTIAPELYNNKNGVGIIAWANDKNESPKAIIISFDNITAKIFADSLCDINTNKNLEEFAGKKNSALILTTKGLNAPATYIATNYKKNNISGWYLPSIAEMKAVANNINKINTTIKKLNLGTINMWYWTSTEDIDNPVLNAYSINPYSNKIISNNKLNSNCIRPFLMIE